VQSIATHFAVIATPLTWFTFPALLACCAQLFGVLLLGWLLFFQT